MKHDIVLTLQKYQTIKVEITDYVSITCQIHRLSSNDQTKTRPKREGRGEQGLFFNVCESVLGACLDPLCFVERW